MSSGLGGGVTSDEGGELGLAVVGDDGLFHDDFLDELVDISPAMRGKAYSWERLSRSMDLVSCSPLLRMYSRMMPGG